MSTGSYGRIVNNFLHDLATGTRAACVLVVWVVTSRATDAPPAAAAALAEAAALVFWMAVAALVVIGATGGIRLRYWRLEASAEELAKKRRALMIKHALFLGGYGGGTAWAWSLLPIA